MHYTLIRLRKRTLSIQVNAQGRLIARAPYLMPKFLIDKFIKSKSSWIAKRLSDLRQPPIAQVEYVTPTALKSHIQQQLTKYSRLMGVHPQGVRFTTVRTYWGTCSPAGVLSFNLALRFAPPSAVTYVVVHELAHLRWRTHGKRFWEMVKKFYPQTNEMRRVLRQIRRAT